jgi:hypothetical protein
MKPDHDPTTHQHAQAGIQQKEKADISEANQARHFIREEYLQRAQVI